VTHWEAVAYMVAHDIGEAGQLAMEYGPDAWHDDKGYADGIAAREDCPNMEVFRITVKVEKT
jgi:hypothetical protein